CSTSTATAPSTMSPIPAARKRSAKWPALLPGQTDPVSTSGSSARAASQNGPDRAAVGEVPHACGDDAAVPRHPRHLPDACDRIVHDVDHELGERRIEAASFERQILSRRADDLDSGMAAA